MSTGTIDRSSDLPYFSCILAREYNSGGIGNNGGIPWKITEDMKEFKRITSYNSANTENIVIMGRVTKESLKKPLPGRINIVVSPSWFENRTPITESFHMVSSLDNALKLSMTFGINRNIFVIGGAKLYREAFQHPSLESIYCTTIQFKKTIPIFDTFFDERFPDNFFSKSCKNLSYEDYYLTFDVYSTQVNTGEKVFINLLEKVLEEGEIRDDRTGTGTVSLFGPQIEFDNLDTQFPLLTSKRVPLRIVFEELIWMLRGQTNNKILNEKKVTIWDDNSTREFLDKVGLSHYPEGELGPVYGAQWRNFGGKHDLEVINHVANKENGGVDQIAEVLHQIKTNPTSRRIFVSAWNPKFLKEMSLPPCFTSDTIVLTNNGYKFINEVTLDDQLYTHKGRFKPINNIQIKKYNGDFHDIRLYYHPHSIKCTPEHPFYTKKITKIKNQQGTVVDLMLSEPKWVDAKDLTDNDYIGMAINTNSVIPEFNITKHLNKNKTKQIIKKLDNLDEWYLFGYFLGDGWLDFKRKGRFYLVFGNNERKNKLLKDLHKFTTFRFKKPTRTTGNSVTTECHNYELWHILKEFGHLAHNKMVPQWIHDAPKEYIEKFIEGYTDADGCYRTDKSKVKTIAYTTVSKDIAFSIQRLYLKVGKVCSVTYQKKSPTYVIQGRTVNQRNLYHILYRERTYNYSYALEQDYCWFRIHTKEEFIYNEATNVYNFEVDDDNSYCVENVIVHNCHMAWQMYVRKQKYLDCKLTIRSNDLFLGAPFNIASYALLIHMIASMTGYTPGRLIYSIGDAHIYKNHLDQVKEQITRDLRSFPLLKIKKVPENIEDWEYSNFELSNYNPHPTIKGEMAI